MDRLGSGYVFKKLSGRPLLAAPCFGNYPTIGSRAGSQNWDTQGRQQRHGGVAAVDPELGLNAEAMLVYRVSRNAQLGGDLGEVQVFPQPAGEFSLPRGETERRRNARHRSASWQQI